MESNKNMFKHEPRSDPVLHVVADKIVINVVLFSY